MVSIKKISQFIVSTLFIFSLHTSVYAQEVVHVYNWSDYIDEDILAAFEKETGIKVIYDVFDSNDILETKLLAGNSGYDLVVPSGAFLGRQIQAGVYKKLDTSALPNLKHMWPVIMDRTLRFDPKNAYSVNYLWGTTGIGYNKAKIEAILPNAPFDSWSLFFNPDNLAKLAECGVYVLDASDEVIPAALNYIGEDPISLDVNVIKKAEPVLKAIRPYIAKFHSSEYINALANGDICLAVGWSGDILQARDRAAEADNGVEVTYVVPKEGALMWFDQLAIPADAKNPENALMLMNYLMDPKVIAKVSNYVYYANGNITSQQYINDDVIEDPSIYPAPEAVENLYVTHIYPQKSQRALTRLWTRVKSNL